MSSIYGKYFGLFAVAMAFALAVLPAVHAQVTPTYYTGYTSGGYNGGTFYRTSVLINNTQAPFADGTSLSETYNPQTDALTMALNQGSNSYDLGFYADVGTLGDLAANGLTITGSGTYGVNLWIDPSSWTWNSDGTFSNVGTTDGSYGLGSAPSLTTIDGSTIFTNFDANGCVGSYSVSDLANGICPGVDASTPVAVWVGVGPLSSTGTQTASITINPTLVFYGTANVANDLDSGYAGNNWASDSLTRTIKIWQIGAYSFFANVSDTGTASIIAGQTSPGNLAETEPFNGTASITGGQDVTFTATSVSGAPTDGSSISSYDMDGNSGTGYYFSNGPIASYFPGISNVTAGVNGFSYTYVYDNAYGGTQTWVNSNLVPAASSGDIVTNKLVLSATENVINDPDSGNAGCWALDNFTRTVVVYQTGPNAYKAVYTDVGTSNTFAGAITPEGSAFEAANGTLSMNGYENITFTGTPIGTLPTGGVTVNALDMGGTPSNILSGYYNTNPPISTTDYFIDQYFTDVSAISIPQWSWTYVYDGPLGVQTASDSYLTSGFGSDILTDKLVINATMAVNHDEDSGLVGYWGIDNYTEHIKVYETAANTYLANDIYTGTWCTFTGALSPQNGVTEPANGCGALDGGYNATFTATAFNSSARTSGNIGTYNLGGTENDILLGTYGAGQTGDANTTSVGYQQNWLSYYFLNSNSSFSFTNDGDGWSWTYTYNVLGSPTERWFDNGTDNLWGAGTGDIVTYPTLTGTSGNTTVSLSPGANTIVVFSGGAASLTLSSNSLSSTTANVVLANVTNNFTGTSTPSSSSLTFTKVFLLDINVTSNSVSSLSLNVTATIPCGTDAIPYIYNSTSGTWTALVYTSNATACTITFSIPADPVIGVFQSAAAPTTTTGGGGVSSGATGAGSPPVTVTSTVSTTTVAPTTPAQTTPSQNSTKNVTPQVVPAPAATTTVAQASTASLLSAGTLGGVEIAFSAMLAAVIIVAAIAAVSIRRRMRRNSNDIKAVKSIKPKK